MKHLESFGIEVGKGRYHEETNYSLALLYNLIESRIAFYLADFRLTTAKFNVLMVVKHLGGQDGMSQVEISKRLIVTPSNMTRLLDKLEKEDLIFRSVLKGDRRVNTIQITPKGSKLLDRAWPGYSAILKDFISPLEPGEQKALSGLLVKWLGALIGK